MKSVTSAENLLKVLRSARDESRNPSPFESAEFPSLPPASLPEAVLEALNNTLPILDPPSSAQFLPSRPPLPPINIAPCQIPLSALQADRILGPVFGVNPAAQAQLQHRNNSGGTQSGSEDTYQAQPCGLPSPPPAVVPANDFRNNSPPITTGTGTADQGAPRPRRHTAQKAMDRWGSSSNGVGAAQWHLTPASVTPQEQSIDLDEDVSDAAYIAPNRTSKRTAAAAGVKRDNNNVPARKSQGMKPTSPMAAAGVKLPFHPKPYDKFIDPSLPPDEIRKLRRILSNRESARRSRKRKALMADQYEEELNKLHENAVELQYELDQTRLSNKMLADDKNRLLTLVESLQAKLGAYEGKPAVSPSLSPSAAVSISPRARRSAHLQSPMKQVRQQLGFQMNPQVSHRVRCKPAVPAVFFPSDQEFNSILE